MLSELSYVPPYVPLLVDEVVKKGDGDWLAMRRRLKEMLPELRDQSEAYIATRLKDPDYCAPPTNLDIYVDGGLDLFRGEGSCQNLTCRISAAEQVSRSLCLLGNTVWFSDPLSVQFEKFGRATNAKLEEMLSHAVILTVLSPLIESGAIKFRTPLTIICGGCYEEFQSQVLNLTNLLFDSYSKEFSLEDLGDGEFVLSTGSLYVPELVNRISHKSEGDCLELNEAIRDFIYGTVHSTLTTGQHASAFGGALFSNSKVGLAGLAFQEQRASSFTSIQVLDGQRRISVPWVSELTPAQIVQLRHEADLALPAFRALMARRLGVQSADSPADARDVVAELREQAALLRGELDLVNKKAPRFWGNTFGLLGLGLGAYGIAADQALAAGAALLPLFQLLTSHDHSMNQEVEKIARRPGYVLVKAQDILSHDH